MHNVSSLDHVLVIRTAKNKKNLKVCSSRCERLDVFSPHFRLTETCCKLQYGEVLYVRCFIGSETFGYLSLLSVM